jgi:CheY-like chemotaxis protein
LKAEEEQIMGENLLAGKNILAVDDEPDVLDTLEELLPMCRMVKAGTNAEAKEYLQKEKFDLVILDIMGVDGYNLLSIANQKNIPAVMLTANALSVQDTIKSFKLGAAFYVPKEKMGEITTYLEDILEAQRRGKTLMGRWMDRLESYYDKRFGADWKKDDPEFWGKFPYWY